MRDFLTWIEASTLGELMRAAGPWAYATVNLSHVLGVAILFGSILVLDLRFLGFWRTLPVATLAGATSSVSAAGFALAALSGAAMLATNATEYIGNPFLLIKFPAIAVGLVNVLVLSRWPAWRAREQRELDAGDRRRLGVAAAVSLASWLTAITAGRMIAYW